VKKVGRYGDAVLRYDAGVKRGKNIWLGEVFRGESYGRLIGRKEKKKKKKKVGVGITN
jgi:hypothetical protein